MVEAYPLSWPTGYPRTKRPRSAAFQTQFAVARNGLGAELVWRYYDAEAFRVLHWCVTELGGRI